MKQALMLLISVYQRYISPFTAPSCRFYPSCSEFMSTAISDHGVIKGLFLGFQRLCRCHPFHEGGYDPVPQNKMKQN